MSVIDYNIQLANYTKEIDSILSHLKNTELKNMLKSLSVLIRPEVSYNGIDYTYTEGNCLYALSSRYEDVIFKYYNSCYDEESTPDELVLESLDIFLRPNRICDEDLFYDALRYIRMMASTE